MNSEWKKFFVCLTIFLSVSFLSFSKNDLQESFVIKKKKNKKCGRKSKEQACRDLYASSELVTDTIACAAGIQKEIFAITNGYLEGEDPFAGCDKHKVQALGKETLDKIQKIKNEYQELLKELKNR
ncbi:hypothetical protein KAH94_05925 [bacterium]|nr:hypothetical protein [bacterium]